MNFSWASIALNFRDFHVYKSFVKLCQFLFKAENQHCISYLWHLSLYSYCLLKFGKIEPRVLIKSFWWKNKRVISWFFAVSANCCLSIFQLFFKLTTNWESKILEAKKSNCYPIFNHFQRQKIEKFKKILSFHIVFL